MLNSIFEVQVKNVDLAIVSILFFPLALWLQCTGASRIRCLPRKNGNKRPRIAFKRALFTFPKWRLVARSAHAVQWCCIGCSSFRYQNVRTGRGYILVCPAGHEHAALHRYCVSTTSFLDLIENVKRSLETPTCSRHRPGTIRVSLHSP